MNHLIKFTAMFYKKQMHCMAHPGSDIYPRTTGELPQNWKTANIVEGPENEASNYHLNIPSLTVICCNFICR